MRKPQNFQWKKMTMGTCYYPEHWSRELWQDDLQRMKAAGITVIRVAEFAWNKVEPEEGVFTFDFWDEFMELCKQEEMQVIFGTPTATPPAWLTEKYPEVLNCRQDGVPYRHGARRHYNYNSPKYRELSARIVEKLAQHYGKHPAIVGWQIDNELNCEVDEFYSEADSVAFRNFVKEKYKTLDNLNEAWGTVFWNQTYTDWEQIYVPRPVLNNGYNPHLRLDYYRFISESAISFCKMQAEIISKYKKDGDYITTNGMFWNLDNHKMAEECLDVYTYDSYPSFAFGLNRDPKTAKDLNDRHWSKNLTEVRSICPHFGIMEQQSGAGGWTTRMEGPAPRPGQLTLWAMQSVAHGADYISFFRWRTCTFSTEMYWHGILDYDNRDNRKLAEVKDFYNKLKCLDEVCGADYTAAFGVLKDYDNMWDTNVDVWHRRVEAQSSEEIFIASEIYHTPYNTLYLSEDTDIKELQKYPVLIYAHPVIMTGKRAALLKEYVANGGILIIGCRSGYKQENGKCVMLPQPGLLQEITGSDVRDFTFTSPVEQPVTASWNGQMIDMPLFNDIMEPVEGGETLAFYDNSYYAEKPAIIRKNTGKGYAIHFGSTFSRESMKVLLEYTGILESFQEMLQAPQEVEIIQRVKGNKKYFFVLNYMGSEQKIVLKKQMRSLYDNVIANGEICMKPYETIVYEVLE